MTHKIANIGKFLKEAAVATSHVLKYNYQVMGVRGGLNAFRRLRKSQAIEEGSDFNAEIFNIYAEHYGKIAEFSIRQYALLTAELDEYNKNQNAEYFGQGYDTN